MLLSVRLTSYLGSLVSRNHSPLTSLLPIDKKSSLESLSLFLICVVFVWLTLVPNSLARASTRARSAAIRFASLREMFAGATYVYSALTSLARCAWLSVQMNKPSAEKIICLLKSSCQPKGLPAHYVVNLVNKAFAFLFQFLAYSLFCSIFCHLGVISNSHENLFVIVLFGAVNLHNSNYTSYAL